MQISVVRSSYSMLFGILLLIAIVVWPCSASAGENDAVAVSAQTVPPSKEVVPAPATSSEADKNAKTKDSAEEAAPEKVPAKGLWRWVKIREGRWRLELTGGGGLHQGDEDHSGDGLVVAKVEYEIPVMAYGALGLRMVPTFVMPQDHGDTVWGAGVGLAARVYHVKNEQRGLYVEADSQLTGHYPKFDGNSGSFNFLSGFGAGYKFKKGWHVIVRFDHLSNAGLAKDNSGFNAISAGIGYTF